MSQRQSASANPNMSCPTTGVSRTRRCSIHCRRHHRLPTPSLAQRARGRWLPSSSPATRRCQTRPRWSRWAVPEWARTPCLSTASWTWNASRSRSYESLQIRRPTPGRWRRSARRMKRSRPWARRSSSGARPRSLAARCAKVCHCAQIDVVGYLARTPPATPGTAATAILVRRDRSPFSIRPWRA